MRGRSNNWVGFFYADLYRCLLASAHLWCFSSSNHSLDSDSEAGDIRHKLVFYASLARCRNLKYGEVNFKSDRIGRNIAADVVTEVKAISQMITVQKFITGRSKRKSHWKARSHSSTSSR